MYFSVHKQYFHDLAEYDHWLPTELRKLDNLLLLEGLKGNREDASRLLSELKVWCMICYIILSQQIPVPHTPTHTPTHTLLICMSVWYFT